jgi:ABC-type glycerol-3-phosphate transport system substrate-binding protein
MMRRSFAVVLVMVAIGVLGACGGDDDDVSLGDTDAATTTVLTPSGFTGQGSEDFCRLARDYSAQIRTVGANVTNPAQLKSVLDEVEPAVAKAVDEAPDEIKPDIQYLATAFKKIRDSLQSGTQIDIATLSDPQFQTSADRVTRYGREVCGIAP